MDLLTGLSVALLLGVLLLAGMYKDRTYEWVIGRQWFDNDQRVELDGLAGYPHVPAVEQGRLG